MRGGNVAGLVIATVCGVATGMFLSSLLPMTLPS